MPIVIEGQAFEPGWWRDRLGTLPPETFFDASEEESESIPRKRGRPKKQEPAQRAKPSEVKPGTRVCPDCNGWFYPRQKRCYRCQPEPCRECGRPKSANNRCFACKPSVVRQKRGAFAGGYSKAKTEGGS